MAKLGPTKVYGSIDVTGIASLKDVSVESLVVSGVSTRLVIEETNYATGNSGIEWTTSAAQNAELIHEITDGDIYGSGQALILRSSGSTAATVNLQVEGEVYATGQRVFHDTYHPNADKWTTARTLTLTGDVSGSVSWDGSANASLSVTVADDSHRHDKFETTLSSRTTNDADTVGDNSGFLVRYLNAGATGAPEGQDHAIQTNSYSSSWQTQQASDWRTNAWYVRGQDNGTWSSWERLFADNYHPNADTLTTARTISLTGDATGSVSFNGSANVSITVDVNTSTWADTVDVNAGNTSASWYDVVWHSGDTLYSAQTSKAVEIQSSTGSLRAAGVIEGASVGINNVSATSGGGLSLYGGAEVGQPDYGLMFAGPATFGTYGWVAGDWATYFTMSNSADRGWIFKSNTGTSGNVFSIEAQTGNMLTRGVIALGGDIDRYMTISSEEGSWTYRSDNGVTWEFGARNTSWVHNETSASSGFYYYQSIQSAGNITAYSDRRVKDNIEIIPDALDKVCKLNGYTYDRTDVECARQTGVIAQEVQEVLPEAVVESGGDAEGHLAVAYGNMVGLLIEAIKEQQQQIDELKKQIK